MLYLRLVRMHRGFIAGGHIESSCKYRNIFATKNGNHTCDRWSWQNTTRRFSQFKYKQVLVSSFISINPFLFSFSTACFSVCTWHFPRIQTSCDRRLSWQAVPFSTSTWATLLLAWQNCLQGFKGISKRKEKRVAYIMTKTVCFFFQSFPLNQSKIEQFLLIKLCSH